MRAYLLLIALLASTLHAFYLPGIAPHDFREGDRIEVLANKLTSSKNKLPYAYYSLPFCKPTDTVRSRPVNLGQVLMGERAFPTKFEISMKEDAQCKVMCQIDLANVSTRQYNHLRARISQAYSVRLNVDNMPLVVPQKTNKGQPVYHFGYRLGFSSNKQLYINNHLKLKIYYNQPSLGKGEPIDALTAQKNTYRIVGFEVEPHSVAHTMSTDGFTLSAGTCPVDDNAKGQLVDTSQKIVFTYDVTFVPSKMAWATRWDPLLAANKHLKKIQWFSIVNSLMIGLFLTALVGTVVLRTVLKDFVRYNGLNEEDDEDDVTGWKLVHGDVFRPPKYASFLCVCVGAGAQVLFMAFFTQLFALVGFLSPANRGGLITALLSLYILASTISGYCAAQMYSSIETGAPRRVVTLGSALLFPGITFSIFFLLNLAMWFVGSSGAVPFSTLLLLLFMWFGISVPLVFVGAYIGYKRKPFSFPTRVNQIQRQIPKPTLNVPMPVYAVIAGILPFGTVFMELVFILNSVWTGGVYYLYGALVAVFFILIITCAEMSVVFTYLSLSAENWASHWHMSFWGSGSAGLYMFVYSIYYMLSQPDTPEALFVSSLVVVCWSLVVSGAFALMCGTVGFYASFFFTRAIYSSIRID